ncbi:hypothetical protein FACS1894187_04720 [Synergistales bacterium]|nr:hypothetical protein FACS1894187_04720 [Synergistales bacterium]
MAIANGHVSGRSIGAPLTDLGLKFLKDAVYEKQDFVCDYKGHLKSGQYVCSSTFFIKHEGILIGFLCLNMDTSLLDRLREDWDSVMRDYFNLGIFGAEHTDKETFSESIGDLIHSSVKKALLNYTLPPDRLSQQEKINVIETLYEQGFFQMRGAVESVAEALSISEASVYRYLKKVQRGVKPKIA